MGNGSKVCSVMDGIYRYPCGNLHRDMDISFELYNNRIKYMIIDVLIAGTDNGFTYFNLKNANIYGINNMYRMKLVKNFVLSGGYCYTYAYDMATGNELTGFSKHSGNAELEFHKRLKGYFFSAIFNGRIYSKKVFQNYNDATFTFFNDTYPAYSLWKLSLCQEFFQTSVRLSLGVDNIFDYRNSTDLINVNPGRRFFVAANISCDKFYNFFCKQKK